MLRVATALLLAAGASAFGIGGGAGRAAKTVRGGAAATMQQGKGGKK